MTNEQIEQLHVILNTLYSWNHPPSIKARGISWINAASPLTTVGFDKALADEIMKNRDDNAEINILEVMEIIRNVVR